MVSSSQLERLQIIGPIRKSVMSEKVYKMGLLESM